jgi:hypothetical protein
MATLETKFEEKLRNLRIVCLVGCVAMFTNFLEKLVGSVCPDCTVSHFELKNISRGNKLHRMGGGLN